MNRQTAVEKIIADLPPESALKAGLMSALFRVIEARKLSQADVVRLTGEKQPHVSRLLGGDSRNFSAERLMSILTRLGHPVRVMVENEIGTAEPGITVELVPERSTRSRDLATSNLDHEGFEKDLSELVESLPGTAK
jgi:predicted XRE-type DNA-binding protein